MVFRHEPNLRTFTPVEEIECNLTKKLLLFIAALNRYSATAGERFRPLDSIVSLTYELARKMVAKAI